jgi:hypothetical protein
MTVPAATSNRQQMPTVAEWVDDLREQGFDVKVIWCKENGIEKGRKPEGENVFTIPPRYRMPSK